MESSSSPSKKLQGVYKDFFRPECHGAVEAWYLSTATPQMRSNLKAVVHGITEFTTVGAVMAKRVVLKSLADPDILGANAIFNANNGEALIAPSMVSKTIQWLSVATIAQRKAFRETIGLMQPPKLFSHMRHNEDMEPERMYWKTSVGAVGPKVREIKERHLLHNPSEAYSLPSETLRAFPTNTGSTFVWKLPLISKAGQPHTPPQQQQQTTSSSSPGSGIGGGGLQKQQQQQGGQEQQFTKVTQRAHDATFKGAPWGKFGLEKGVNPTQWQSQTKEDFAETFFLMNKNDRRFQNYNENYIGLLSKQYRLGEKQKKADKKLLASQTAAAAAAASSSSTGTPSNQL